jgi:hypothetical protein
MFLSLKYSGYNRHGEQSSAGQFLILMQPDTGSSKYPFRSAHCRICGLTQPEHPATQIPACPEHGAVARLRKLALARQTRPIDDAEAEAIFRADKFVAGCPACERYKSKPCEQFTPSAITYPMRGIVRYVRMRQLGHFMMGSARVGKTRLTLSGSYGSDGLPTTVPDEVYEMGVALPQTLYDAWNNGGGWNTAGSEADAMRQWAKENLITGRK